LERDPEVRLGGSRGEAKTAGHYACDREELSIQVQRLPHGGWVRSQVPLPEALGKDGHPRGIESVLANCKGPTQEWSHTGHRKQIRPGLDHVQGFGYALRPERPYGSEIGSQTLEHTGLLLPSANVWG
jgi:hypothetical protein